MYCIIKLQCQSGCMAELTPGNSQLMVTLRSQSLNDVNDSTSHDLNNDINRTWSLSMQLPCGLVITVASKSFW